MDQEALLNILLSIATGAVSVGVFLLIGIAKNVNQINLKVERLIVKGEHQEKESESQEKRISELEKFYHNNMKKIILIIGFLTSMFMAGVLSAQSSACQFSTCVPAIGFRNTDLMQIYGAILTTTASGGAVSTVTVNNTVTVTPLAGSVVTVTPLAGSIVTVTPAGTNTITGNVGGYTNKQSSTVTTSAGAYSSGDNVGGIGTLLTFLRTGQTTGILNDIVIFDKSNQNANFTIDFWSAGPSGTFTDNAAEVISDNSNYLGSVSVSSVDYITTGTVSRATITGIGLTLKGTQDPPTTIYYTIVTTSTPTYTNNLFLKFGLLQD